MGKTAVVGTTAAVTAAAGLATTFWAEARLAEQGAWGDSGMAAGHLDFTVAAVLLVGVTLVVLALIIALALAVERWLDGENQRDARAAGRRDARRAARDASRESARVAAREAEANRASETPDESVPVIGPALTSAARATRNASSAALTTLAAGTKKFAARVVPEAADDVTASSEASRDDARATVDHEVAAGTAHRISL